MQYLVSVIDDTAGLATADERAAIDVFNDRLQAEGHWVFAGGLGSPSSATVKAARIPYRVPSAADLPPRLCGVLAVLFLVFNEGYLATGPGTDPVRPGLTAQAIRLTRLIRALMPGDGEVAGLLALVLLTQARRTARVSASGELVPSPSRTAAPGTRR